MRRFRLTERATVAILALLILLLVVIVAVSSPPNINQQFDATALFFPLGFAGLVLCLLLCIWFLRYPSLDRPTFVVVAGLRGLVFALGLLLWRYDTGLVEALLGFVMRLLQAPHFPAVALALAVALYVPLAWRLLRRQDLSARARDLAAVGGLLGMALLVYLPLGFDSIGNYESWSFRTYVDGLRHWGVAYELVTRPLTTLPHLVGNLLSPHSFVGFHVLNMLLIWGKAALFYGLLRQHKIAPLIWVSDSDAVPGLSGQQPHLHAAFAAHPDERAGVGWCAFPGVGQPGAGDTLAYRRHLLGFVDFASSPTKAVM